MSNENNKLVNEEIKPLNEAQKLLAGIYAGGDSEEKQNWEDIESFYSTLMTALVTANSETIKMLRIPGILNFIKDKAATKLAINGLDSDIKQFADELNQIHALHSGMTGVVKTPDDLAKCFRIFELYMAFQTRYHSVVMPTVEMIADQCASAARAMSEVASEQEQLQDPTVVSDVEIKTPSNTSVDVEVINNSPTV